MSEKIKEKGKLSPKTPSFEKILVDAVPLHQIIDDGIRKFTEFYRGQAPEDVEIDSGQMKDGKPVLQKAKHMRDIIYHLDGRVRALIKENVPTAKNNDIELQQYLPTDLEELAKSVGMPKKIGEQTVSKLYQAFASSYFQKVILQIGAAVAIEKEPEKKAKLVQLAHAIAGTGREKENYSMMDHNQQMNQINEAYQGIKAKVSQQTEYKDPKIVISELMGVADNYHKKVEKEKKAPIKIPHYAKAA